MSRSRDDQKRHDNVVDGMIALAVLAAIAIAGCSRNSTPPKDGEWRIVWQQDSTVPWPAIVEAHVPYDGASPEQTSYTLVTP